MDRCREQCSRFSVADVNPPVLLFFLHRDITCVKFDRFRCHSGDELGSPHEKKDRSYIFLVSIFLNCFLYNLTFFKMENKYIRGAYNFAY